MESVGYEWIMIHGSVIILDYLFQETHCFCVFFFNNWRITRPTKKVLLLSF